MAADRAPYIDQSQSLNLFVESPSIGKLSSMYFHAWKQGLKTTYYLRSRPATKISKGTCPSICQYRDGCSGLLAGKSRELRSLPIKRIRTRSPLMILDPGFNLTRGAPLRPGYRSEASMALFSALKLVPIWYLFVPTPG